MIPSPRLCSRTVLLVGAAQLYGCRSPEPARDASQAVLGSGAPQHIAPFSPPGVVVDPPSEVPRAATLGDPDDRVLSLVPPVSSRAAVEVVRAFFRAITDENVEALAPLLTPDATAPSTSRGTASALLDHWRGRMNRLRYQLLANETLYDESQIETYRFHDWDATLAGRSARPLQMLPSDILLRVPMQLVRRGNDRLFGDEIVFLLRRHKGSLGIAEQIEDFPQP